MKKEEILEEFVKVEREEFLDEIMDHHPRSSSPSSKTLTSTGTISIKTVKT